MREEEVVPTRPVRPTGPCCWAGCCPVWSLGASSLVVSLPLSSPPPTCPLPSSSLPSPNPPNPPARSPAASLTPWSSPLDPAAPPVPPRGALGLRSPLAPLLLPLLTPLPVPTCLLPLLSPLPTCPSRHPAPRLMLSPLSPTTQLSHLAPLLQQPPSPCPLSYHRLSLQSRSSRLQLCEQRGVLHLHREARLHREVSKHKLHRVMDGRGDAESRAPNRVVGHRHFVDRLSTRALTCEG
ncbi:unnamed protein product [Closterium sp. NIES-53]